MNALLVKTIDYPQTEPDSDLHNLRLADDVKRGYCKCPTAHAKDMRTDGLSATSIMIYIAIANVQRHENGEFFRSNSALAKDLQIHKKTVSRCISELRNKGYLSIWFVNGGRRMRVSTRVRRGVRSSAEGGTQQRVPDKENNRKKTTQPMCVFSSSLLGDREDRALWEGSIERLAATYGEEAVIRGLSVYDSRDPKTIDNPIGFLTKAIKLKWLPSKKTYKKTYKVDFYKRGDH